MNLLFSKKLDSFEYNNHDDSSRSSYGDDYDERSKTIYPGDTNDTLTSRTLTTTHIFFFRQYHGYIIETTSSLERDWVVCDTHNHTHTYRAMAIIHLHRSFLSYDCSTIFIVRTSNSHGDYFFTKININHHHSKAATRMKMKMTDLLLLR